MKDANITFVGSPQGIHATYLMRCIVYLFATGNKAQVSWSVLSNKDKSATLKLQHTLRQVRPDQNQTLPAVPCFQMLDWLLNYKL